MTTKIDADFLMDWAGVERAPAPDRAPAPPAPSYQPPPPPSQPLVVMPHQYQAPHVSMAPGYGGTMSTVLPPTCEIVAAGDSEPYHDVLRGVPEIRYPGADPIDPDWALKPGIGITAHRNDAQDSPRVAADRAHRAAVSRKYGARLTADGMTVK